MAAIRLRVESEAGDLPLRSGHAGRPDQVLVEAGAAGDTSAFAELYRRHREPALRAARGVAANADDAADAVAEAFTRVFDAIASGRAPQMQFRPYLLMSVRNAAIDQRRRANRLTPAGDMGDHDGPATDAGPSDRLAGGEDSALIAEAFADLPPRWQAVLWLTEVEGRPPREAADVLGLSANNVSQLAVRARARLRERYLQAHVRNGVPSTCQGTVDALGAYLAGTLAPGARGRVEAHLDNCQACRERVAEVEDLGMVIRRALGPVPLVAAIVGRLQAGGHKRGRRTRPWSRPTRTPRATGEADKMAGPETNRVPRRLPTGTSPVAAVDTFARASLQTLAFTPVSAVAPFLAAGPAARAAARMAVATVAALMAALPGLGAIAHLPDLPRVPAISGSGVSDGGLQAATASSATVTSTTTTTVGPGPVPASPSPSATTNTTAPAPPPPVAAQPDAVATAGPLPHTTSPHTVVAQAVGDAVGVHLSADLSDSPRMLANPQPSGAPLVFVVVDQTTDALRVLLPTRPNSSTGWIARSDVSLSEHDWSIVVELGAHRLTVFQGTGVFLSSPVGVGTTDTPTPGGLYYTKELIQPTDASGRLIPDGPYGPYAYGLSGFSNVLSSFAGGDGVIGIHGTNDPSGLGRDVSHGCLRVSNQTITAMAGVLPLGVPVDIRP